MSVDLQNFELTEMGNGYYVTGKEVWADGRVIPAGTRMTIPARDSWSEADEENFLMMELGGDYRQWVLRERGRNFAERIMRRAHKTVHLEYLKHAFADFDLEVSLGW